MTERYELKYEGFPAIADLLSPVGRPGGGGTTTARRSTVSAGSSSRGPVTRAAGAVRQVEERLRPLQPLGARPDERREGSLPQLSRPAGLVREPPHRVRGDPKIVQTLMRHSMITLTFDVYGKSDDDLRRAIGG